MVGTRGFVRDWFAGCGALGGRHRVPAVGVHVGACMRDCMGGRVRHVQRVLARVRTVDANHAGQRLQRQDQHEAPADEVTNCVSHQGLGDHHPV